MKAVPVMLLSACLPAHAADFHVPVEKFQLSNGMRVILSRDNTVPVVAVYMIFNIGARAESKGRTGFAHLFEHMMFEGSANAPKGTLDRLIESSGGVLNGSTHPDYTDYFEVMPSNNLATALWLEADRMRSLAITAENLQNQKEAVKQERRLHFDNRPYTTAILEQWPQLIYQNRQSSHSLIGSFEDLNAATVEDVSRFFKTYYAPNNAALALAGDIEPAEARKLVEGYLGAIPSQPQPALPDLTEPPDFKPRTEIYKDPHARVPALVLGYPGPARRSPDYYALSMLDAVLTAGDSSRFKLNLVKGAESVIQYDANLGWPFASPGDYKDPSAYAIFVLYKPSFTAAQVTAQIQGEIDKIVNKEIEPGEMNRVRALVRASRADRLQSILNRARLLGQYEVLDHNAEIINSELDQFLAVTPAEIQQVARKYLTPDRRAVLEIVPASALKEGN
jgi:zinc protease